MEHRHPAYGYTADAIPHPVPMKAAQGRTKTLPVLDPQHDQAIADIFGWRTTDKLGVNTIVNKLNADPAAYPKPPAVWTVSTVATRSWRNPKYTGYHGVRPPPPHARRPPPPLPRRAP